MIETTTKTSLKLKNVSFLNGELFDEESEEIDLMKDLETLFGEKEFSLIASFSTSEKYDDVEEMD